jgi:hypothetical protein
MLLEDLCWKLPYYTEVDLDVLRIDEVMNSLESYAAIAACILVIVAPHTMFDQQAVSICFQRIYS